MMLVVSGLPAHFKYHDAKAMIKQEAHVTDFILDNLVVDSAGINGTKKVTVGLADSNDAPVLMRRLTGFDILGNKLNVTAIGKNNAPLPPPWKEEKQQRGLSQPQKEARGFTQKAEPPWRSDKTSEHPQKGFNHAPEHQRGYNKPTETPRSFDQQTELQRGFNQQTTSGGFGKNPQGLQVENPKGFNQQAEPARGFGQPGGTERGYGRETEPPRAYGQQQMDQPGPDQYGYGPRHGSNASHGFPVDKTHEETRKSGQQMPDSGANPSRHSGQAPSTLGYRDHGSQAPKLRVQAEDRPYGQREFDPNSRPGFSGPSSIGFNPHGFLSVPPLKAELSKPPVFDRLGPQYNQPYESQISAQPFSAAPLKPPANRDFLGKPSKLPPPRQQSPTRINSPNRHLSPRRPPRHGLGRDSPPRQGQFEGSPSRQREPWLSPQRQGPLGSSPPHQGVPRRSPPRHGPLKMSPPRQASFRRSPLHQGQFRGSPPRLGVQRRTPPHQGPYRRSPPRERAPRGSPQRQGPFRGSPSRQGPFRGSPSRQGSFRGSPPLQGQFRRSPRRSPPRQMSFRGSSPRGGASRGSPQRQGSFRRSPPRERAPRGSPQRQGPFRGSPSRQGPFRESPSRQGQFRESPPRLGVLRGSSPRQKPFRRSPPRQEPPRGSPQRHGLMRSSPPHQGQYRGSPPHQGYFRGSPPRQGPLRVSPSRQGPQVESMGIFERPRVHKLGPPKGRTAFETSPAHPSGNYPNEPYPAGGEDAYIPPPPWVDPQNELEPFHNRGPRFKERGQEPSLENYGAVEVRKRPEETIKESSGGEKSRKPRGSRGRRNRSRSPPGPGGVPSWRPIGHSPGRHPDQRSTPPCSRTPHHRSRSPLRGRNRGQASPPPTWGGPEHRERSPSPGQVAPWAESVLHDMAPRTIRHPFVTKEPEFGRINDGGPPQGQPSHHRSPRHGSPGPYRDEDMLSRKLPPRFSDHSPLRSEPPMPHFENTGPYHPQDHPHMEEVHFHAREDIRYSEEYPPQEGGISPSYERPEPWLQENEALDMGHLPLEHIGFEASSSRRSPEKPRRIYLLPEQDRSVRMEVATIISKQIIGYFNPEPADDERFQKRLIFSMMKKIADRIDDIFHETVGIQFDGILRVYRQVYPEDEDAKLLGDCILTCKLNKIKNTRMVEGVLPTAAKRRAPSPVDRRGPPALAPPAEHHAPPPGKKPKQPKSHELTIPAIIAKGTRPMKPGPSPLSTAPIPKYVQGDKKVYKEKQLLQKLEFSEQSLYQLDPLQRRELDSELDYIMSLAMTVLPQNPQKPTDARMVKSIKGPGGAEIRQVLDLHVTKRLLNIPSNLSVRIFGFPTLPSRQTLESFLKEFRAVSMKKSGNKRVYVATLPDYYHYDSICQLGTTELDGATIQIKPFHLTGPKLQHMQKFMKKQSREQTQVHPTFNPPKDAEESINKPPSTDTRGSTLIAQNEEIVAKSGTKSSQSGSKSSQSRGNITQPAGKSQPVGQSAQTGSKSSGGNPSQPGGKSSKPQGKHSQSEAGRYTNGGNSTKDSRAREESRDTGRAAYVVDEIGPSDNECGYIPFDDLEDY